MKTRRDEERTDMSVLGCPEGSGGEGEDGLFGDPSSLVDWPALVESAMLCSAIFRGYDDLDHMYAQCRQGYCVVRETFL